MNQVCIRDGNHRSGQAPGDVCSQQQFAEPLLEVVIHSGLMFFCFPDPVEPTHDGEVTDNGVNGVTTEANQVNEYSFKKGLIINVLNHHKPDSVTQTSVLHVWTTVCFHISHFD